MKRNAADGLFTKPSHFALGNADKDTTNISSMSLRFKAFWGTVNFQRPLKKLALRRSKYFFDHANLHNRTPLSLRFNALRPVARIPFRFLKRIFDHSRVRFTANPKLALWAQTLDLRPFRFTKNGLPKFFHVRSREPGQHPILDYPRWVPHLSINLRSRTTVFFKNSGNFGFNMLDKWRITWII